MNGELDGLWLAGNVDLAAPSCYRRKSRGAVSVAAAPANSVAGIALGADRVQEA